MFMGWQARQVAVRSIFNSANFQIGWNMSGRNIDELESMEQECMFILCSMSNEDQNALRRALQFLSSRTDTEKLTIERLTSLMEQFKRLH
jgi:hypothetical protein